MNKVLITGASGFINANLTRRMLSEGYEVGLILRRQSNLDRLKDILPRVKVLYADLLDYRKLFKEVHDFYPDYIFHSATFGAYPDDQKDEYLMFQTNMVGTYNLLKATGDIPYKCFIHAGSSSEYGLKDRAISEKDLLEPINHYGVTKASATLLCQMFARTNRKNIVILRPFSVYGPYERMTRLIPYVILKCIRKEEVHITSGEQKRDFIYVDDVMDIYLRVTETKGIEGEIFNVGGGEDISVKEVVKMIFDLTGSDPRLLKIGAKEQRAFEAIHSWKADLTRLNQVLGFHPRIRLEEGLRKTIDWVRESQEFYVNT